MNVLIAADDIQRRVREIAADIHRDHLSSSWRRAVRKVGATAGTGARPRRSS